MVPFEMSTDARMMLARMSFIYERERNERIRISRDEDIVDLINYAIESVNKELKRCLDAFIAVLSPSELRELADSGANIYRGAVVPPLDPNAPVPEPTGGVKMYRGVAVPSPEQVEQVSAMNQAAAKAASAPAVEEKGPKKAKRVYRGRVIED